MRSLNLTEFICAAILLGSASIAGAGEPRMVPGPDGPEVQGSVTFDGVTYTAEDLQAMVDAHRVDPNALPADLPPALRMHIYKLLAASPAAPAPR